jgi:hypothetical protein
VVLPNHTIARGQVAEATLRIDGLAKHVNYCIQCNADCGISLPIKHRARLARNRKCRPEARGWASSWAAGGNQSLGARCLLCYECIHQRFDCMQGLFVGEPAPRVWRDSWLPCWTRPRIQLIGRDLWEVQAPADATLQRSVGQGPWLTRSRASERTESRVESLPARH